jgi:CubicO group peptidase (beta-lactamase class C family)
MSPTTSAELTGLLEGQLAPLIAQGQTPGVVAVAVRGQDQALYWAGQPARDAACALDGQTRFEVGSLTKTFTGLLLAQLVCCGEVGYDDPISAYLPAHALPRDAGARQITLAQLATHTAGLPHLPRNLYRRIVRHGWADPYAAYRLVDLYRATARLAPRYPPGGPARYSTFGVGLLGQLLAKPPTGLTGCCWPNGSAVRGASLPPPPNPSTKPVHPMLPGTGAAGRSPPGGSTPSPAPAACIPPVSTCWPTSKPTSTLSPPRWLTR